MNAMLALIMMGIFTHHNSAPGQHFAVVVNVDKCGLRRLQMNCIVKFSYFLVKNKCLILCRDSLRSENYFKGFSRVKSLRKADLGHNSLRMLNHF